MVLLLGRFVAAAHTGRCRMCKIWDIVLGDVYKRQLVDNTKFDMVYSAVIGDIGCGAILTNHCPDPRYAQLTFVKECSV